MALDTQQSNAVYFNTMKYVTGYLLIVIFLCGCSTHRLRQSHDFYVSEGVMTCLLPVNAYEGEMTSVQEIRITYAGTEHVLTGIIKLSQNGIQVIILANMARMMTLNYTSAGIEYE